MKEGREEKEGRERQKRREGEREKRGGERETIVIATCMQGNSSITVREYVAKNLGIVIILYV